jgi:hypothetical protein
MDTKLQQPPVMFILQHTPQAAGAKTVEFILEDSRSPNIVCVVAEEDSC